MTGLNDAFIKGLKIWAKEPLLGPIAIFNWSLLSSCCSRVPCKHIDDVTPSVDRLLGKVIRETAKSACGKS
jgi:hypothetical protein